MLFRLMREVRNLGRLREVRLQNHLKQPTEQMPDRKPSQTSNKHVQAER